MAETHAIAEQLNKYMEPLADGNAEGRHFHEEPKALLLMAEKLVDQITRGQEDRPAALGVMFKARKLAYRMQASRADNQLDAIYFSAEADKYQRLIDAAEGGDKKPLVAFCVEMANKSLMEMAIEMEDFPPSTVYYEDDEAKLQPMPAPMPDDKLELKTFYTGSYYMRQVTDEQMAINEKMKTENWRAMAKNFIGET